MPALTTTAIVSNYIASVGSDDLPEAVKHEAARALLNYAGCAVGGSQSEAVAIAEAALRPHAGQPAALVIGRGWRTDVLLASLLNCISSTVHSFDDTHAEALIHPTGPVASALLSVAQMRPMTGKAFVAALAAGIEIGCRTSKAISVAPARANTGWIQTGVAGGIGAAAAAAKALGLDARRVAWALGTAANNASGLRSVRGMGFPLIAADASRAGLQAALLAEAGFTASEEAFEGDSGFLQMYSQQPNAAALGDDLSRHFEVLANTYKPYPCGVVINPAIDAALAMRTMPGFDVKRIAQLRLRVNPPVLKLVNRPDPQQSSEAGTSIQHWVAAMLLTGVPDREATANSIRDADHVALRKLISLTADDALAADAASLEVVLGGGKTLRSEIAHCIGSAAKPMTDDDLTAKFVNQGKSRYSPAQLDELARACWSIGDAPDTSALLAALAAVPVQR